MKFETFLLGSLLLVLGCGGGAAVEDEMRNRDPQMPGGPTDMVDYPKENLGFQVGQRVANLSFLWLKNGASDVGKEPTRVTMADFYALRKEGAKLLFLSGAAQWCGPCVAEAGYLVNLLNDASFQQYLETQGGRQALQVVQVVMQDLNRNPATREVLDTWASEHKANFGVGIDPKAQISSYIPENSIPQALFIRLSDMTLLHREIGALDQTGLRSRFTTYLQKASQ